MVEKADTSPEGDTTERDGQYERREKSDLRVCLETLGKGRQPVKCLYHQVIYMAHREHHGGVRERAATDKGRQGKSNGY
ncbi:hypothetical protein ES703_70536 [subsurface metagenome]